jgi:hypothetical protein
MGRRDDLRDGLANTYAAHVHNAIQDVVLLDLIREIGALVLDRNKYVLSWRVLSGDGHVMPGKLSFTVGASSARTSARGAAGS